MSSIFQFNHTMMDICTAIKRGYFALVRFLIDLGADVNFRDGTGKTPLILCAFVEDQRWAIGLAQTLLEKSASVGSRDRNGLNALHYACVYGREALVSEFLRAADFPLNIGDRMGHSALFYAVNSGKLAIVKQVVDSMTRYSVSVDRANKLGITPLMQAYKNKRFDIAEFLIQEGCADEDLCDNDGRSAREMGEEFRQIYETEQELGIRRARSALRRIKSAPPRSIRKVIEDDENEKKEPVLPMQRDDNKLLRICKDCDLRNDPMYMFNLSPVDCFVVETLPIADRGVTRQRPLTAGPTWRREFRYLYKHLEIRNTNSFRDTIIIPRSVSPSQCTDMVDGQGLRIPGSERLQERRGSTISSKGSLQSHKMKQVERLVANPLVKGMRRGSNQSPTGGPKRPTSRQMHQIPVVKEP